MMHFLPVHKGNVIGNKIPYPKSIISCLGLTCSSCSSVLFANNASSLVACCLNLPATMQLKRALISMCQQLMLLRITSVYLSVLIDDLLGRRLAW